ncbi:MAG: FMN-binding glutamate synthase family protein [Candidatus Marinimicrobia bacterium]|nr:FMN-binding glutamate synthase family protein [Candidatus Neomarinimicrobiota bacterium]MCF7828664.1 FMN-binding glutamate synthase family protein [Candidatus Neomarinimicrobiota bacterium]MCF7880405.1 FMN-binding glutamate synthase family protein [Candidatus Neomarinimicrobiota bacterium]
MQEWRGRNDALGTVNRGDAAESGLCTLCRADCKGKCETWLSSIIGRKILYPRDFGDITAGSANISPKGVGYHSLRIQGYVHGAEGLPPGLQNSADDCIFPNVKIETEFGREVKTKSRVPIMTGALGSTEIARKYWDSFAIGSALVGFPIVIGENVVGVDQEAELEDGSVVNAPELDRRIQTYQRYMHDGYGGIFVQLNVEDTRNGVAEYVSEHYGDDVIIELKWGQGAKDIGGEIQVRSLDYAKFLKERGYVVDPDPTSETIQKAYKSRAIRSFARHSRLGGTDAPTTDDLKQQFMERVEYLRGLGFKRISLKTGAYDMQGLAMALRFAADAKLDLVTIDGAGGGTGMSPWNMMEHWGIPSVHLHSKAVEYADTLAEHGIDVPDLSFAGGFAREDHIFKALALGSPYAKLVCMGRAPMIPGFVGANIQGVFDPERQEELNGNWNKLPSTVNKYGETPERIFAGWYDVEDLIGPEEMKNIPLGAVAMWNYADKLSAGLQQFMAGVRKFDIHTLNRKDLMSANMETEEVTGIPHMTKANNEEALDILKTGLNGRK